MVIAFNLNFVCQGKDVGTSMVSRGAKVLPSLPRFRIVIIAFNLNFVCQGKDVGTSMGLSWLCLNLWRICLLRTASI
jgi:hypothetical protein